MTIKDEVAAYFFGGLLLISIFIRLLTPIYYKIKDLIMTNRCKKSKEKYPKYFEWRKEWYNFRDAANEHLERIEHQKEKINSLINEEKYLLKQDLWAYDYILDSERRILKNYQETWELVYEERYNQLDKEWSEHEEKRKEKGITVWNIK